MVPLSLLSAGSAAVDLVVEMKVLITGSRNWTERNVIEVGFDQVDPTLIIHGDCKGADWIADAVAVSRGIDRVKFPANWGGRGKSAGMFRNRLMFDLMQPDVVLAFPRPESVGTIGMINYARSKDCCVLIAGEDF